MSDAGIYYPLFLELKNRPCLVIGGGQVAFRKAESLLCCGAKVTVVSPRLSAGLKQLARKGKIRWKKVPFRPGDLAGRELVVAATDDQQVNLQAAREARRRKIWINVADQPALCSFIVPSVVRRGRLVLAVSTGGASPTLAKWIRKDLETRYGPAFGKLVSQAAAARGQVHRNLPGPSDRKRLFEKALKAYFETLTGSDPAGSDPNRNLTLI